MTPRGSQSGEVPWVRRRASKERTGAGVATRVDAPARGVFSHIWFWRSRLPGRKGAPCRVLARGRLNSILVEFEDGERVVTSRYAVRLA